MLETAISTRADALFKCPLVDLGSRNAKYAGVFTPLPEIDRPKMGITEVFLSGAENYFEKFEQFSYIYSIVKGAISRFDKPLAGLAVDIGSGFGNTVIPLLENHPDLTVLATDISPDLLAICRREADRRGLDDRCMVVAMDAQQDYFEPGIADVVFGGAVLHRMVTRVVVKRALDLLKPGGVGPFSSNRSSRGTRSCGRPTSRSWSARPSASKAAPPSSAFRPCPSTSTPARIGASRRRQA